MSEHTVTNETIDKLAKLSKLQFNGSDKEQMKKDLEKMLDFVGKLDELDTDNVAPLIHVTDDINVLRNDEARTIISQKEALLNAPKKDSTYFKFPKVIKD